MSSSLWVLFPEEYYLLASSVDGLTPRPRAHPLKLYEHCGSSLIHVFQAVTKDHESVLRKQQEDIGYLSRHLDHVINFTKWATAKNGGTALLYCKRLVTPAWSFIPSTVSRHSLLFPQCVKRRSAPEALSGAWSVSHVMNWEHIGTQVSCSEKLLIISLLSQILFQIGNLLRAKCSTSFIPQSTVRFQCRSSYWASNIDLGKMGIKML